MQAHADSLAELTEAAPGRPPVLAALDLEQLIARLPDAIAVVKGGVLIFANDAMLALVGASASFDVVGTSLVDLVAPKDWSTVFAAMERARAPADTPAAVEVRLVRVDGRVIQAELLLLYVAIAGAPAVAVVARDLSALRQIDLRARETDRMVAIGTLAAGIAHEINTPIQYIGDSAYFLQECHGALRDLASRYRRLAGELCRTAEDHARLDELRALEQQLDAAFLDREVGAAIRRTLDGTERVARIVRALRELGHPGPASPAPTDLDELVQTVLIVATNELKYVADVELQLGRVGKVTCVAPSMSQVLLNLLVNAAHAIADKVAGTPGRGRIVIRTVRDGSMVHVSISDTGTGIPPDVQPRVFDPFFTTKPVGRGPGQGLAITRSIIVERHGGKIWFETEPGVGTTFHFVIPSEWTADLSGNLP
ncbi:ATP-binding protein [Myxococcota bacterium]|nr:ATP-binding protein [Myxococcota bacterium]